MKNVWFVVSLLALTACSKKVRMYDDLEASGGTAGASTTDESFAGSHAEAGRTTKDNPYVAGGSSNKGGVSSAGGTNTVVGSLGGTAGCLKTPGSAAGTVCVSCGYQTKAFYNCDGSRYVSTTYSDYSNNSPCVTQALCGDTAAYWVRNAAGASGATCEKFCASVGATCGNECDASGNCPASTTAGYNQSETYGCDSKDSVGNQCSSTVVHPSNAYNAACCCRGLGTTVGGTNCVKTEGESAGVMCVGCGYKAKTFFHCDGTRYISSHYYDFSNDAVCVTQALCGDDTGSFWVRNANSSITCDAFCASVNSVCTNSCTATGGCPASSTAGYNQNEAGDACYSNGSRGNRCNSFVYAGTNAYNAYCCCQVL